MEQEIIKNPDLILESDTVQDTNESLLPLLPLKNVIIIPKSILPVIVGRASSIAAVEYALKHDKMLFITTQKDASVENPTHDDVFRTGTKSTILQVMRMPNGSIKILVEGLSRAYAEKIENKHDFMCAHIKEMPTTNLEYSVEIQALWRHLKELYDHYAKINEKVPADLLITIKTAEDIDAISDTLAVHMNLSFDDRQALLETPDLKERLIKLSSLLKNEIDILETEQRIKGRIQKQVEKSQREYYLTEQIKAIQKELGREDQSVEINEMRAKLKKLAAPEEAKEKVEKELRRLEQMPAMSSEAVVSRNYVDWVLALPWNKLSRDRVSMAQAEKILNQDHAGLKKPKERILEFIAAKKFSKNLDRSPILCLVGPPGVGKTSLARSIAESLGREFVRISLGGVRDEAEIRGHRRTYIGALPGKIIQAFRKASHNNPVILLDEIDKMTRDVQGDPSAALLEVLDPEQNKNFNDHFLDMDYDLSKAMFIATANMIESIPYPLFDRMEIISLSGYTEEEKLEIAKRFLIPKGLEEHGLQKTQFVLPEALLRTIINEYTKEAGVRQLERVMHKLMRKAIQVLLKDKALKKIEITPARILEWLGFPKYKKTSLDKLADRVGLSTGLAWTEVGGDVLEIETTVLPGKGGLTLTGQLGEVMQESAYAALSYIRSRAQELGLKTGFYSNKDIHIHLPEGSTPKDGPSAGITMATALVSALTKIPTRSDVAMTGEITLRGRVLGIGGLKEKLLAAKQHGFKVVLVPKENEDDVKEINKEIPDLGLQIIEVENLDQVMENAFAKNPFTMPIKPKKKPARKKKPAAPKK